MNDLFILCQCFCRDRYHSANPPCALKSLEPSPALLPWLCISQHFTLSQCILPTPGGQGLQSAHSDYILPCLQTVLPQLYFGHQTVLTTELGPVANMKGTGRSPPPEPLSRHSLSGPWLHEAPSPLSSPPQLQNQVLFCFVLDEREVDQPSSGNRMVLKPLILASQAFCLSPFSFALLKCPIPLQIPTPRMVL